MPGRYKNIPADEYESDDFEATDTLIGRNRTVAKTIKKKPRPVSAGKKKTVKRPVTPRSGRRPRPLSAGAARTGRELWMTAVKNRQTVGLANNRRSQSPRHKTASEYWIDTLRKTGQGISTESTGMNTFSGKRPRDRDMPYLSTSSYLRQMVGADKPGKMNDPTVKASPGTPAYKSQEEYYEQILEYKKQATAMNQEVATLKAKIRRLEEDNLKKEKEIDGLLHPHKSEELRRTLADKKPDSGAVIHSLKQKILKLETQMREKEASYVKLQSDLKTTKVEELRQQMEVFYQEIVRLQTSKETGMDKSARHVSKDGTIKVKALNETILRLTRSNEQLQSENRMLKEDLQMAIENTKDRSPGKDYADMNRKELLRELASLERKVERLEKRADTSSVISYESRGTAAQGKLALEGSLEDRLDQLDKRESELLDQLEKNRSTIKQLRAENLRYKRRCEELEQLLSDNRIDYRPEPMARAGRRSPEARRPLSGRSAGRPHSARSESERPPSARPFERPRSGERPRSSERPHSGRGERPLSARRRRDSLESSASSVRRKKIQAFKENRSAKTIQRNWRTHQQDKRRHDNEKIERFRQDHAAKTIQRRWTDHRARKYKTEKEDAEDRIRSALLGHGVRKGRMANLYDADSGDDDDDVTDNEGYNESVNLIFSSVRGHQTRSAKLKNHNSSYSSFVDDDDSDIIQSPARSTTSSQRQNRPYSPLTRSRPQSAKSRTSLSSSKVSTSAMPRTTTYAHYNTNSKYDAHDDDF